MALFRCSGGGGKYDTGELTNFQPKEGPGITLPFTPKVIEVSVHSSTYYNSSAFYYYDAENNINTLTSYNTNAGWTTTNNAISVSGNTVTFIAGSSNNTFSGYYTAVG